MPTITKRTRRKKIARRENVSPNGFFRVTDYKPKNTKMVIFGRNRTGKTTLVATFPKPIAVIAFKHQEGISSITNVSDVDACLIEDTSELAGDFQAAEKYETKVLDHASSLEELVLKEVLGLDAIADQKSWGMANREDYFRRSERTRAVLRSFVELPGNVVVLANEKDSNEFKTAYEGSLNPFITAALSDTTCKWLYDECDHVFHTFIREGEIEKEVRRKVRGRIIVKKEIQKLDTSEFCLRMGPHHSISTGSRTLFGVDLPAVIVNPTYEKIVNALSGKEST